MWEDWSRYVDVESGEFALLLGVSDTLECLAMYRGRLPCLPSCFTCSHLSYTRMCALSEGNLIPTIYICIFILL